MSNSLQLLLDLQATQSLEHKDRGIARYAACHAAALTQYDSLVQGLLLNPTLPAPIEALAKYSLNGPVYWNTKRSVLDLLSEPGSVYYMMSPFEMGSIPQTVVPDFILKSHAPLVVTLYDLIPLVLRNVYLKTPSIAKLYERRTRVLYEADLILSISQSAKEDAVRILGLDPTRIHVIGGGVDPVFCPKPNKSETFPKALRELKVAERYVLSIMGDDPRKNLERLCVAYARLPSKVRAEYDLVVVGRYRECVIEEARNLVDKEWNGVGRILFMGGVSDDALIKLYQFATLSIMPSLYEGFGLPVVEGIACGCPTITSNTSSLPEVLQWESAQFDPRDVKAMTDMIQRGLTDKVFRSELIDLGKKCAKKHTWSGVAERTHEALQTLKPRCAFRPNKRRRIALVGPMPPEDTGIADHNASILRELLKKCDVDVYTPESRSANEVGSVPTRVFPLRSLGRTMNPAAYDAVIYVFGNSIHHWATLNKLRKFRGLVWLHDARFYGIYVGRAEQMSSWQKMKTFVLESMVKVYGTEQPLKGQETKPLDHCWYIKNDVNFSREIIRLSDGVIAHSGFAMSMFEHDGAEDFAGTQRWLLPMAFRRATAITDSGRRGPLTIGTFGRVYPTKGPDVLIDALAGIRDRNARLVFAGKLSERLEKILDEQARRLGVRERVHFTGKLTDQEYAEWLRKVDISVQLRTLENGESSGAVCDAMATGLPVITNLGAAKEFPADCIIKLPSKFTAEEVLHEINQLSSNRSLRKEIGERALAFARKNSFAHVADLLLKIVDDYVSSCAPDRLDPKSDSSPFMRFEADE